MRAYFMRLVTIVAFAGALCTPAFLAAQVLKVEGETRVVPAVPAQKAEVAVPAQPRVEVRDAVKKVEVKAVRIPAPAQVAAPAVLNGMLNGGMNANAMVQQWTVQFRPILRVEYLFLRVVCDPTKEQRIPIARAGLKALDEAAKKYVEWQTNQNRVVGGRLVERPAIPDTRQFLQEALAEAVKANLSAGQAERYRAEIEARAAEQKRVALLNLVAKLDQTLVLSPEQRDKLQESLSSHWGEAWSQSFQSFNLDDQYLPMMPDILVTPSLNDEQKKVWVGTQKITYNNNGISFGITINNEPLDDAFSDQDALKEDPEPKPKPKPESKPESESEPEVKK